MSSEPIERRVSYVGDRLRGSKCPLCGRIYPKPRVYCGSCGRKTVGKMEEVSFFFEKGILELCTVVRQPTNNFMPLSSFLHGLARFRDVSIPVRVTDMMLDGDIDPSGFEGREVVPRFRRRHASDPSGVVPTASLTVTFADEYYPYAKFEVRKPSKESERPGIVGYAVYTSKFRIKEGKMVRSVPFLDEDAVTAAVEAGKWALIQAGIDPSLVAKVYVGSESNPYAVKPAASKVAQVLELGEKLDGGTLGVDAIDTQFACKAASSMFKDAAALAMYPGMEDRFSMVIGADNSQAAPRGTPGGELDFFVGFGGTAFIIGKWDVVAEIEDWYSVTSDTADFWRRDGQLYPRHGGRFTGGPAYFKHVIKAGQKLMERARLTPRDVDYFVCHQPNIPFPIKAARALGFKDEQYMPGLQVGNFGNTYSGSSPLGLCAILDVAEPHERILLVSYGSGAGSDAYLFYTTPLLLEKRKRTEGFNVKYQATSEFLEYVDYDTYRRFKAGI